MHNLPTPSTTPQDVDDVSARSNSGGPSEAKARLRKACDSCSIRKVKCDEEGPPCRACASLDIPCTFDRPSRRRGPPNRHAEAIKKKRLESPSLASTHSSPTSPIHAAHTLASFAKQQVLSAESICPLELLEPLVDDYFTYIHPLVPIPHEPSFREALQRREDLNNPAFLSLLSAMIGTLVVSFPRKPLQHLKSLRKENLFPNSISMINRCHNVSIEARGTGFLDRHLTVYDAATSYLLALTSAYSFRWRQCKLYFGESLTILRTVGVYKAVEVTRMPNEVMSSSLSETQESQRDFITQEMGRRAFWILYVGVKSLHQLGASFTEVFIPPSTQSSPYPPLPAEVDDFCICRDNIMPQPIGVISEIVGFNANVRIFQSYDQLNLIDITYGSNNSVDWARQRHLVEHCLISCKRALEGVPSELMLFPRTKTSEFGTGLYTDDSGYNQIPTNDYTSNSDGMENLRVKVEESPQGQRKIQYEIQKANIYTTQLGTRSHIVEKYWTLCGCNQSRNSSPRLTNTINHNILSSNVSPDLRHNAIRTQHPGQTPPHMDIDGRTHTRTNQPLPSFQPGEIDMATEREEIVRDLLTVLRSISQVNMEPNGASLINKIRLIASTLLEMPRTHKGAFAIHVEQYLAAFLDILVKLEHGLGARNDDHSIYGSEPNMASSDTVMGEAVEGYGRNSERFHSNMGSNAHLDHIHGNQVSPGDGFAQYQNANACSSVSTDIDADEEAELRNWADLREYQNHLTKVSDPLADL